MCIRWLCVVAWALLQVCCLKWCVGEVWTCACVMQARQVSVCSTGSTVLGMGVRGVGIACCLHALACAGAMTASQCFPAERSVGVSSVSSGVVFLDIIVTGGSLCLAVARVNGDAAGTAGGM